MKEKLDTKIDDGLYRMEKEKIGGSANCEQPILMCLVLSQGEIKRTTRKIVGNFRGEGSEVGFDAQTRQKIIEPLSCPYYERRLLPLIRIIQQEGYWVELEGRVHKGVFVVQRINLLPPSLEQGGLLSSLKSIDNRHFQTLVARLLGIKSASEQMTFSTREELILLFGACREEYPQEIQDWAEDIFSKLSAANLGNTDRRHLLQALTYVLNVAWSVRPVNVPEISVVRKKLDEQFYGLESVKQQICQAAAQIRHSGTLPKWGVLLSGAPGVGKTAIASSIADILGMSAARLEFASLQDPEAISGGSRVYENGKPGLVAEQLYSAGTANLVMVLNEIDKAAEPNVKGSIQNVLLPLLDGMGFMDTYLELSIPTDGIFFIATVNDAAKLSRPLLDRFIQIDIPPYSVQEKEVIFERYSLPRALGSAGVESGEVTLSDRAKEVLFQDYALEPGVRDLERSAQSLVSYYILQKEEQGIANIQYSETDLRKALGPGQQTRQPPAPLPGTAFSAFIKEGTVYPYAIQALIYPSGTEVFQRGELKLINIDSPRQRENCRLAYEAANRISGNALRDRIVVLAATQPLDSDDGNYVGCAACGAILSSLFGTAYSPETLFLGGVDLFGRPLLEDQSIDPYLKQLGEYHMIYGAVGLSERIFVGCAAEQVDIWEAPTISILCELARANSISHRDGTVF